MTATVVNFTLYTDKTKVLKLTVKDLASATVDLSGASASDIYWIMQRGRDDKSDPQYKQLAAGITFFTDGTDGILLVTIDPVDVAELEDEAATNESDAALDDTEAALTFWHQLSIELSSQPAISMEGEVTILAGRGQTVHIELEAPAASDSASEVTAGTLQTDNNLTAPSAADSGSSVDAGVLTTTIGS